MIVKFFKEYTIWYVLQVFISITYLLIFTLYHFPMEYFLTAFFFHLLVLICLTMYLYYKYKQKMLRLVYYKNGDNLGYNNIPSDLLYQEIIENLRSQHAKEKLQLTHQLSDYERLIKIWSHQMKVPLSALSLMYQTNQLKPKDVEQQLFKLENYIENLISYTKLNDYQDDFKFQEFSLNELVKEIIKKRKIFFITKSLSVSLTGDIILKSDAKWLSFALSQIIDNAVKYSKDNSSIDISIQEKRILIRDYGIGILEEDLPRLFEEGFTGFNGHEHQKATGLGLYMANQILSRLNFKILVESKVEQGTSVLIILE